MTEGGTANRQMAIRYFNLFVNRAAYTIQSDKPDGKGKHYYYRPKGNVRLNLDTIRKHLSGEITIGLYAINPVSQRSKWVAIDADYEDAFEHLLKLQCELRKDDVHAALERSRRGAHLWIFAAVPLLASECRLYIYNLASRLGVPIKSLAGKAEGIEVFPRQDRLDVDEFGNAIRGPLGLHRAARGKRFWFYGANFTFAAQLTYLERLKKITESQMRGLVAGLTMPEEFLPKPTVTLPPFNPNKREFRILEHVPKGRRSGKDYRTRCPSCGDRDKYGDHLAVSVSDPRKYKCWAGCTKEEIRAAVGCPIKPWVEKSVWQTRRANA